MNTGSKQPHRFRKEIPGAIVLIIGVLMVLASCATPTATTAPTSPPKPTSLAQVPDNLRGEAFRSNDYVVYRMASGETVAQIAEGFLGDPAKAWVIEDANPSAPMAAGSLIAIPLRDANKAGLSPDGYQTVSILCYHSFAQSCTSQLCTPANVFDRQMQYLKDNNYRVISLAEFNQFLKYNQRVPNRSVIITIDDGYRSTYDIAYPILKKFDYSATFFIYTDFVSATKIALNWDQIREMRDGGMEIGSHTLSHGDLTKKLEGETSKAYLQRVERELLESKRIIDEQLQQDTIFLAYPYGKSDPVVRSFTRKAGYQMGLSVRRGGNPFFIDPLNVKRDQITAKGVDKFVKRINTFEQEDLRDSL